MSWKRVKSVILVTLLAVNLLLACCSLPLLIHQRREESRLLEELKDLYAQSGITLTAQSLPREKTLTTLDLTFGEVAASAAAGALLGEGTVRLEDAGPYTLSYVGPAGSCRIGQDCSFFAGLTAAEPAGDRPRDAASRLTAMGCAVAGTEETPSGDLLITQSVLGCPVFGQGLTIRYEDGAMTELEGLLVLWDDLPIRVSDTECCSAADALAAFLSHRSELGLVCGTVGTPEQGWLVGDAASVSTLRLIPVWRLETDTGTVLVNGIDRTLTLE